MKKFTELKKSKLIKEKIINNTPNIQKSYKGKRAHGGFLHSVETKERIKNSLKEYRKSDKYCKDKNFVFNGKQVLHKEYTGLTTLAWWNSKTDEEKQEIEMKRLVTLNRWFNKNKHDQWGLHKAWYEEKESQPYRSSWELKYMGLLDTEKVFYKSNKTLYIQYWNPDKKSFAWYLPDFLIYSDSGFTNLVRVEEIKPRCFVNNPINQNKFFYAEKFCKQQGVEFCILTESELISIGVEL